MTAKLVSRTMSPTMPVDPTLWPTVDMPTGMSRMKRIAA